jgi:starvation-inducible DNA-binding protein
MEVTMPTTTRERSTVLPPKARKDIATQLNGVLADTFTLYLKTHNYHWNVVGPRFRELHLMFEEEYNELWVAADLIAERIRALGHVAPATYREYAALTSVPEPKRIRVAKTMISELLQGHEICAGTARKALDVAEAAEDQVTVDLLTQRMQVHDKTAWMLRSMLQ